jgi:hypothetical protein
MQKINLPAGSQDEAFLGEHQALLEQAFKVVNEIEGRRLIDIGALADLSFESVCSILAYAHVAQAAYALADAAATAAASTEFDPDEFGRRCAAIAREQIGSLGGPSLGIFEMSK